MTHAQKMYRDTNQREFALSYKDLAPFLKEEINLIHEIQLCSNEMNYAESRHSKADILKRLKTAKEKYEAEYGPYELDHYNETEVIIQHKQLTLF